ncbi:hypothetical protein GQ42DRAFT_129281, partial [Ramicandelaber brevisporus]
MDDILRKVAQDKPTLFTVCDLSQAFHQLRLTPDSQKLISFHGPDGRQYVYTRVAFGLSIAPSLQHQAMQTII